MCDRPGPAGIPSFAVREAAGWGVAAVPKAVWGRANVEHLLDLVGEVRMLSKREMREMLPDCRVITERFLLMPKSYIAVRDQLLALASRSDSPIAQIEVPNLTLVP